MTTIEATADVQRRIAERDALERRRARALTLAVIEAKVRVQGEQLDTLRAAIGETGDIEWLASACLDEAMACQQIGGFGETVGVLSQAAVAFQRIAAAVPQDPEEGRA